MAITVDKSQILQWTKDGRVFHATHGALTTPAAFETELARQTPDLMVRVPEGHVIVPMFVSITTEATGAAVFQVIISACNNDPGVANHSAFTPVNLNTRYSTRGSSCTCYITATGDTGNAPTGVTDLLRVYVQVDIDSVTGTAPFEQVVYSPLFGKGEIGIIGNETGGTDAFMVHVANGTSSTGFILAAWAEFTYAEFYA